MKPTWGLLPFDARQRVFELEWDNINNLKARLLGDRPFPLVVSLKPPSGKLALDDLVHFRALVKQWQAIDTTVQIKWTERNFRRLGQQQIPHSLIFNSIEQIIDFLGPDAQQRQQKWATNMLPLLSFNPATFPALVKHLQNIETVAHTDAKVLPLLLPQLKPGLGQGSYLRALPLVGVDTKFVEQNSSLITDLLDCLYDSAITDAGGLMAWLGCNENPKGWLMVRPLCAKTQEKMAGLGLLKLSTDQLRTYPLPAANILVVENIESGLGLPELPQTIAVIGGGKNVAWMDALWLKDKHVGYWGDLDTYGLAFLADARQRLSTVTSIMMDLATLKAFEHRMAEEPTPMKNRPDGLIPAESVLFEQLKGGAFENTRLEQERLSADFVHGRLLGWLNSTLDCSM
jgi:hypothetical protein